MNIAGLADIAQRAEVRECSGRVVEVTGPLLEAELPGARLGAQCTVGGSVHAEVVGFRDGRALLVPLEPVDGLRYGSPVTVAQSTLSVPVGDALVGRVIDPLGEPLDGKGPLQTTQRRQLHGRPARALERTLVQDPLPTGIRVVDGLLPLAKGQRISIAAGSGVGKSTLLGMLARSVQADVIVVCLVGERGREVREFVELSLGPEGLARSVLVVATSDRSPALQIKAALAATAVAEHFRDQGKDVLLLLDSLTRLALAQRQIGLSAGEPPTTRGYTPSVFSLLPPLLERAGPGTGRGSISAIYAVLVEADDDNDPIADAVRGIVDGHVVLSRKLASHGHFPAVDVLKSLSRVADRVMTAEHKAAAEAFRSHLATWHENEELVRLGAYRKGSAPEVDRALELHPEMVRFLRQPPAERCPPERATAELARIVAEPPPKPAPAAAARPSAR